MKLTKTMSFFDSNVLKKYTSSHHNQRDSISFFQDAPEVHSYSKLQVDCAILHKLKKQMKRLFSEVIYSHNSFSK